MGQTCPSHRLELFSRQTGGLTDQESSQQRTTSNHWRHPPEHPVTQPLTDLEQERSLLDDRDTVHDDTASIAMSHQPPGIAAHPALE